MKLRIAPDDLAAAVSDVVRIVPSRSTTPALAGILIEADLAAVTFSAFDFERSLQVRASAEIDVPDRVLVSGRLLAAIVKVLPKKPVEIESDGTKLTLKAGASTFTLPEIGVDDYPALPIAGTDPTGTMKGGEFIDAVNRAASTASRDDSVLLLAAVEICAEGDRIAFTTTDRFRLSTQVLDWTPRAGLESATVVVPASMLVDMARSAKAANEVALHFDSGNVFSLTTATTAATARVLDESFVKWPQLMPADFASVAVADSHLLSDALNRASVTSEVASQVFIEFTEGSARIRSAGEGTSDETVKIEYAGPPIEFKCNSAYLLNGIKALDDSMVTIGMSVANRPLVLFPGEADLSEPLPIVAPCTDIRHLVMPVRGGRNA